MKDIWSIEFSSGAEDDLAKLDKEISRRVIEKLDWLIENLDSIVPAILTGEYSEFYKLRVGDWRIIYKIDRNNRVIIVSYVDRRNKVYKRK